MGVVQRQLRGFESSLETWKSHLYYKWQNCKESRNLFFQKELGTTEVVRFYKNIPSALLDWTPGPFSLAVCSHSSHNQEAH